MTTLLIPSRKTLSFSVILGGVFFLSACNSGGEVKLDSQKRKMSYAIGQQIGGSMKKQQLDIDVGVERWGTTSFTTRAFRNARRVRARSSSLSSTSRMTPVFIGRALA